MNTYEIAFIRENGTQSFDYFTAPNEQQARRDFKERHRHGTGSITSVELIRTDAPATKQQERDALAEIQKIVETLGPDSYLAIAFEGCFDDARENIENDFALSMNGRWQDAEQKVETLKAQVTELEGKMRQIQETARWNAQRCDEEATAAGDIQRRAEAAEAEVITLKAKLYDLMVAGK